MVERQKASGSPATAEQQVSRRGFLGAVIGAAATGPLAAAMGATEAGAAKIVSQEETDVRAKSQTIESVNTPPGVTVRLAGVPSLPIRLHWGAVPGKQDTYLVEAVGTRGGYDHRVRYGVGKGPLSDPETTGSYELCIKSGETLVVHRVGIHGPVNASVVECRGVPHLVSLMRPQVDYDVEKYERGEYHPDANGNPMKRFPNTTLYVAELGLQALQRERRMDEGAFGEYAVKSLEEEKKTGRLGFTVRVGMMGCDEMSKRMGAFVAKSQGDPEWLRRGEDAGEFRLDNRPPKDDPNVIGPDEDVDFTLRCPAFPDGTLVVPLNAREAADVCREGLGQLYTHGVSPTYVFQLGKGIQMRLRGGPKWKSK